MFKPVAAIAPAGFHSIEGEYHDRHQIPTDFSDYDHYRLHEGYDDADERGIPVYQSRSTGALYAEDATPLTYYEGRLLDQVRLARALIMVKGSDDELEDCLCEAIDQKEQFSRVLEAEGLHRNE